MSQETPENAAKLPVSKASEFKAKREARQKGEELTLPSGLVVLVRRPNIRTLIGLGVVPDALAAKIVSLEKDPKDPKRAIVKPADMKDMLQLQDIIVSEAFMSPKIVSGEPDYDNDQISLEDVEADDRDAVFTWAMGGDSSTDSFRNGE